MKIARLSACHKEKWDSLVCANPESGFMQSWAWSEFKEAEGQKVARIGVWDKGALIAGAFAYFVPASFGSSPLELPHGPVLPWKDAERASGCMTLIRSELASIAAEVRSPLARIEPFVAGELPSYMGRVVRSPIDLVPTPTLVVPIDRNDDDILSAMTQKGRYNIKLAARKGVEISCAEGPDAVSDFYYLFDLTANRHGFTGEGHQFFINMMAHLGKSGMAKIYLARYKGMLMSAAIAVFYGGRATYLYGGSLPFFRSCMASYALHWRMMTDARSEGCRLYDPYGIAPDDKPFHPYARFSQFKSRFGGTTLKTAGAHDIYFYPQLAEIWSRSLNEMAVGVSSK